MTSPPRLDRIHHVAYRCRDAQQTVEWYNGYSAWNTSRRSPRIRCHRPASSIRTCTCSSIAVEETYWRFSNCRISRRWGATRIRRRGCNTSRFEWPNLDALLAAKAHIAAQGIDVVGPTYHGVFKSIYFFDPNGHRIELACDIGNAHQYAEIRRVAPLMLEEWSRTKRAPQHAAWLHQEPQG